MLVMYYPLISETPADLAGDNRLVLNVLINAKKGGLKPMTYPALIKYTQLESERVKEAVNELAKRNLITMEAWV